MSLSTASVPAPWRALVSELNGGRIPDGMRGIRDVDAPCDAFEPAGEPWQKADGTGACETDGHYICAECIHISARALRRREDRCEDCGTKLVLAPNAWFGSSESCPSCDA